jgi:hypothetical protein
MKLSTFTLTIASATLFSAISGQAQTPLYNYPGDLGPGQSVQESGPNDSVVLGARTITAWVNIPANSDFLGQPIAVGGVTGTGDFFGVGGAGGENWAVPQYDLYIDHWGYADFTSTTPITPGQPTFVAMTYDGASTFNFYINGANAGYFSNEGNPSLYSYALDTYTIGGNTIVGSTTESTHLGDVSDVSIYGSVLTPGQIQSLYTSVPDKASSLSVVFAALSLALFGYGLRKPATACESGWEK